MRTAPLLLCALLGACSEAPPEAAPDPAAAVPSPSVADGAAPMTDAVREKWQRSCALCHIDGNGGAPRLGHEDEWAARIATGEATMVTHAIEGFNQMPPLGYCMDCERADFVALTRYMAGIR